MNLRQESSTGRRPNRRGRGPVLTLLIAGLSLGTAWAQMPNQPPNPAPGQTTPGQTAPAPGQPPNGMRPGQQPEMNPGQNQAENPAQNPAQNTAPNTATDAQLQQSVQNAIDSNPSLKAAGVSATVNNGQVTLMGVVANSSLKREALASARSVPGVNDVQNLVTVSPTAALPSSQPAQPGAAPQQPPANAGNSGETAPPAGAANEPAEPNGAALPGANLVTRVNQALMNDPELGKYAITATSNGKGDVTLHGTVPNKADKKEAKTLVRNLAGVRKVHNKLAVNGRVTPMPSPASQPAAQPSGEAAPENPSEPNAAPQPPSSSQAPNQQPPGPADPFLAQNQTGGQSGSQGTTPSQQAPGSAAPVMPSRQQSNNAAGNPAAASESALQKRVEAALRNDPALAPYNVRAVARRNGQVTLSGKVPSRQDKKRAEQVALGVAGVMGVHNKVSVNRHAQPSAPPQP